MKRKILYVCHNHPSVAPGGSEIYALELYKAMQGSVEFDPILLARTGAPHSRAEPVHRGTMISAVNGDPNQYLLYTDLGDFNQLMLSNRRKHICTEYFRGFLETYRPDVVHFQHTLFLGLEVLVETRNTLPDVPIVYTLHDYLPICHRDGQMLRTQNDEPCLEASPRRCHECFPDVSPQSFFVRERFISLHLDEVDCFLAPSQFLLERFVDWGIPRERVRHEGYGRLPTPQFREHRPDSTRMRLGFFGQLNHYKGVSVLLKAMKLLREGGRLARTPQLSIHGANLALASIDFQSQFGGLLDDSRQFVTFEGPYRPAQAGALMTNIDWVVVPSIWWENSPLVIQEAFAHGRPVICSDIGGMAENVEDGVNGLHFRANDPYSLAATIERAVTSPGLWERLHQGVRDPYPMKDHAVVLEALYRDLLARRSETLQ